ncbi:MAG: AAA family ATPase Vps4 [Amphiamblys sp. WSBS2006]|nr:MAG: AAA family ATPase Vps4 [Amphiamblys sp. WSBS2006]
MTVAKPIASSIPGKEFGYLKHEKKYSKNEKYVSALSEKIDEYSSHVEKLESGKEGMKKKGNGDEGLKETLRSCILETKCGVGWDDVVGLSQAKEALHEAVVLPIRFPSLFQGKRKPWKGILLYGPPGTGKSFLAKAAATEVSCTFFSVSSSSLVSKWVGESERLVRGLFELAREKRPAIIFIDEIDSLCMERTSNETESARRLKTELLIQMDGVGQDQTGVLVLGATNTPWSLDAGFRRRFEKKIYVGLQSAPERTAMMRVHVGAEKHLLTDEDFGYLGDVTEGYSGSDISNVVRDALMQTVRRTGRAMYFKRVVDNGQKCYMPCSPGDDGAVRMKITDIEEDRLVGEPLQFSDFVRSLRKTKPSVSPGDLQRYEEFTRLFGAED